MSLENKEDYEGCFLHPCFVLIYLVLFKGSLLSRCFVWFQPLKERAAIYIHEAMLY
uniref:Uncharacterized protein n=1 Tax=Arundo donax TaxID=35708 RepID=A0A0A9GJD2_ARUDO